MSCATCSREPKRFNAHRVTCNWPWWEPWTCSVVAYDAARQRVKLNGWGSTKTFPVAEVWLNPEHKRDVRGTRLRVYATLLGTGAGLGALLGSAITALLMR